MKRIFLAVAAVAAVLSSCTSKSEEITVISYNVRNSRADDGENNWEIRKPASIAMLQDKNPEIFGVQEAYPNQQDYILEQLPKYKCVGVGREDGVNEGEHMSIFYDSERIELLDWGTYWLSETPDEPSFGWDAACRRTATWTKLKVKATGTTFFYVNTHLDHRGKLARKNGLAMVVERIGQMNPEHFPMILTGDFNVFPDDPCLEDLNKIMFSARETAKDSDDSDSFQAFGEEGEACKLDYIYYSGFSDCPLFKVINQTYLNIPYISDHYPIVAKLVF